MSDVDFERRVGSALQAPVPTSARAKQAIMEKVRLAARDEMPARTFGLTGSRIVRHSLVGVALAAGIGSITTLSALMPPAHGVALTGSGVVTSMVIGDSVVDRVRDTLRLVRLIFDAPSAGQVAIVGDFNGWRSDANRMQRDERTGRWSVTLALRDGAHRYAVMVDNTRQARSLLHVARATN